MNMEESQQPSPQEGSSQPAGGDEIEEGKAWAAIAYLGILFLIPLLAKKDNSFAQYHAKQGLVLFAAYVIVSFFGAIPFIGWVVGAVVYLLLFILFIMGLINALSGKKKPLPVIGQYGEKINI